MRVAFSRVRLGYEFLCRLCSDYTRHGVELTGCMRVNSLTGIYLQPWLRWDRSYTLFAALKGQGSGRHPF